MRASACMSRRALLGGGSLCVVAALKVRATRATAQEKVTKAEAKYQDQPKGQQRCEICLNFQPPHSCRIVAGQISPKGWCQFFAARDNAK